MSSQRGNISRSRGQKHQNTTAFKNDKYGATTQVKVCQIQLCWAKLFSLLLHFAFGPFYQIFRIFSASPFQILLKVLWSKVWTCVCCEFFFFVYQILFKIFENLMCPIINFINYSVFNFALLWNTIISNKCSEITWIVWRLQCEVFISVLEWVLNLLFYFIILSFSML